jgi:hypothetical protein
MRKVQFDYLFLQSYRNRYYVLRDEMLICYINDLVDLLASVQDKKEWQVCVTLIV